MKKMLVGLLFILASSMAWALPSEQQVQDAVRQGNFTQAQSMMAEVVADKPNSAKAHYVYAELLAHNGAFAKAAEEANKARDLDPKIGFTDPAKFNAFQQSLQRETSQPARPARTSTSAAPVAPSYGSSSSGGGIPGWVWLVGLVVIGIMLWRGFSRSRAAGGMPGVAPAAGYGQSPMNQGYGPAGPYGQGGVPMQQSRGSGLLGTGLAVAGGVAGGMLLDEALRNHGDGGNIGGGGGGGFIPDANAGELENRSIDFGNGNDWDSGGGGGIDLGGGGDSGGGGWD